MDRAALQSRRSKEGGIQGGHGGCQVGIVNAEEDLLQNRGVRTVDAGALTGFLADPQRIVAVAVFGGFCSRSKRLLIGDGVASFTVSQAPQVCANTAVSSDLYLSPHWQVYSV